MGEFWGGWDLVFGSVVHCETISKAMHRGLIHTLRTLLLMCKPSLEELCLVALLEERLKCDDAKPPPEEEDDNEDEHESKKMKKTPVVTLLDGLAPNDEGGLRF